MAHSIFLQLLHHYDHLAWVRLVTVWRLLRCRPDATDGFKSFEWYTVACMPRPARYAALPKLAGGVLKQTRRHMNPRQRHALSHRHTSNLATTYAADRSGMRTARLQDHSAVVGSTRITLALPGRTDALYTAVTRDEYESLSKV